MIYFSPLHQCNKDTFIIKNVIEINSLLLFVMIIVHFGYKYIL